MEKIIKILKNIKPDIDVTNNNLIDEEILDSFDIVTIVSAVDEEFDIQITARDIVPENFNSVEAIYNLVKKLEEE
ncbi:MAG TPA: phosphopantetheine-binding protein [Clostridiaceae bacterium]|jgi:D-alanine--poly(phosphoribitol) ligase subunit 2|nr:acyl carrier protein [Clostridia bacterium]HBJ12052.1 acyl carrier protein [Clostridiales bacterium]HJJ09136.1 phosphopantetheine-binding protein [Clostridiaceae bacterium]